MTDVDFPLRIDGRGRTATTDYDDHVRDLVEQVLFTAPGERVNRPEFGAGLLQLVFAPNSPELAAATHSLVQGSLQRWLSDVVDVEAVETEAEDSTLRVSVRYVVKRTQERRVSEFSRSV
jgi:uncharacterized protein